MVLGNGTTLDPDAILVSVNTAADQLGRGFLRAQYKNTRHGSHEDLPFRPREARITVQPGINQEAGYFDIQWWANGDYKYHCREQGLEFRFGCEQANESTTHPVYHFHPPNDGDTHVQSCIGANHPPERVTRAVLATWWAAVRSGDEAVLNTQDGLP
jgi:hypothetical protein